MYLTIFCLQAVTEIAYSYGPSGVWTGLAAQRRWAKTTRLVNEFQLISMTMRTPLLTHRDNFIYKIGI